MEERYYFDTSIWMDCYLKRGTHVEDLFTLITKLIIDDSKVVFSNYVQKELYNNGFSYSEINAMLQLIGIDYVIKVQITKQQLEEAKKIAKQRFIPLADAVHTVIARDTNSILVSRDRDFIKVRDIIKTKTPEELI